MLDRFQIGQALGEHAQVDIRLQPQRGHIGGGHLVGLLGDLVQPQEVLRTAQTPTQLVLIELPAPLRVSGRVLHVSPCRLMSR